MSRLTEKNLVKGWNNEYYVTPSLFSPNGMKAIDKLGKLEDIEDELGIDLVTLSKAIHNGVWAKNQELGVHFISLINWNCEVSRINGELKPLYSFSVGVGNDEDADDTEYYLKDYGKTWALTKRELEEGGR